MNAKLPKIAELKSKTLPLINTADTDQEKPNPLKRGGTTEAEAARRKARLAADFADKR
jgi:hypothetical protein